MIKYEKEIQELLRDLFFEFWMSDEDYFEIQEEVFKVTNISVDKLSKEIEVGISNGHSLEYQMDLMRKLYRK